MTHTFTRLWRSGKHRILPVPVLCLMALFTLLSQTASVQAQYCDASAGALASCSVVNNDEFIANVTLNNVSNPSGCTSFADANGYVDYSDSVFLPLTTCTTDTIFITNGVSAWTGDVAKVWVDWNNDLDFTDAGEFIGFEQDTNDYRIAITAPGSVATGTYRMRVRLDFNSTANNPCGETNFGEVEDYSLSVTQATGCLCTGPITSTEGTDFAVVSWSGIASAVSYNVRYKLSSDSTDVATWSTPMNQIDTFLNLSGLASCTSYDFQIQAVCETGDTSAYSATYNFTTVCCLDASATANVIEAEACGDDTNGGCNMDVPSFENIVCGDSVAGTGWWDGNLRDTDWFLFTATQDTNVTFTLTAAFSSQILVSNAAVGCPLNVADFTATSVNQCETIDLNANLNAGTYWVIVSPQFDFDSIYPCGGGRNNYLLTLACAPPIPGPVNDDCAGAIMLIQDTVCNYQTFSDSLANPSDVPGCVGNANDDVYFSFVATSTNPIVSVIGGAAFDAVIEVLDSCDGNTIECVDNTGTAGEEAIQLAGLTIGNTYYLRIYDFFAGFPATDTFQICVSEVFEYCQPTVAICDEFISNVELNGVSNPSGCTTGGYTDYSDSVAYTVTAGSCQSLVVTIGPPFFTADNISVFVDWENNLDFVGANELLFAEVATGAVTPIQLFIPGNIAPGNYRMRVRMNFNGGLGDPCTNSTFGEVEDYTLTVTAGTACMAPGVVTNGGASLSTATINWGASATALSYNVRYKLVSDSDNVVTWTSPISVTDTTFQLAGLDTCGEYEVQVQSVCADGDTSNYTCSLLFNTSCCVDASAIANHIEAEDCGDDTNGGCNMVVPTYEAVMCEDSVAGTGWWDGTTRDTDWFILDLPQDSNVTVTLTAAFTSQLWIIDTTLGCDFTTPTYFADATGTCETTTLNVNLQAGAYWIVVLPQFDFVNTVPCGSGSNNYFMTINCAAPQSAPANDSCQNAAAIACGDTVQGSTNFATADVIDAFCDVDPGAPGVWYQITGDGSFMLANLCSGTNYDAILNVYQGSCGTLTCVGADDDGCGDFGGPSALGFQTQIDSTYFIFVNGSFTAVGDFTMTLSCLQPPANDSCINAIAVACGDSVNGTTFAATVDSSVVFCDDVFQHAPGVWYSVVGDGNIITASMCSGTTYDAVINVFTGSCDSFVCLTDNDDGCGIFGGPSEAFFSTEVGTTYYIYVNGFGEAVGDFTLTISCDTPLVNDAVCGALPLAFGTNGPFDFTTASVQAGEPAPAGGDCESDSTWCNNELNNSLWFSFVAPASGHVSLQSPGFDTQVAVWDADSCQGITNGGAILVGANDDDPEAEENGGVNFSSFLELTCLTEGHTYFVQIDRFDEFTETITDVILTDLGVDTTDAGFTGLDASYCFSASPVTLVPNTPGGTFSGPGVVDDTFDPAVAGVGGPYQIVYSINECTADTQTTSVTELTLTTDVTQPDCNGGANGAIDLTVVGGVSPYSYSWSTSSADEDLFDLEAGTYTVTVSDATGCSNVDTIVLSSTAPQLIAEVIDVQGCFGGNNGAIYLEISGGVEPYVVTWSDSSTTDSLLNLTAGIYSVTVTDSTGCSTTNTFAVSEPAPIDAMIMEEAPVNCSSDSTGTLTVMTMSGEAPFTFVWSNEATDATLTGLPIGTYTVTVTDVNGCTVVASYTLNSVSPAITLTETHTNSGCGLVGSIDLTVVGGVAPFNFAWSGGQTDEDLSDLQPGTNTVTVTDANGCSATLSIEILGGSGTFSVSLTPVGPLTSCHMSYSITLVADSLANAMYIFTRDMFTADAAWVQYNDGLTFQPNTAGAHTYSVIAIDTLTGCTDTSDAVSVTLTTLPTPTVVAGVCVDNTILLTGTPNDPSYTYQWLNNLAEIAGANAATYTATAAGSYRLRITDTCGVSRVSQAVPFDAACFTGFEDIALNAHGAGLNVYPNPNNGDFTIETYVYQGNNDRIELQVVNMLGQIVHAEPLQLTDGYAKADVSMTVYADGMYSVRLVSAQGTAARNIVVTRP